MNDSFEGSLEETTAVVTELVAKARETRATGGSRREFFTRTAQLAGATALGAAGVSLLQPVAAAAATATAARTSETFQISSTSRQPPRLWPRRSTTARCTIRICCRT